MNGISKGKKLFLIGIAIMVGFFLNALITYLEEKKIEDTKINLGTDWVGVNWNLCLDFNELKNNNRIKTKKDFRTIITFLKLIQKWDANVFKNRPTYWLGIHSDQEPQDNWLMQEVITKVRPDFIIETGTFKGGTALFYAIVLEKINENGKVITVDINPQVEEASKFKVFQEKVEVIKGNSVSPEVIREIEKRVKNHTVLVTFDSDHRKEHVLRELELYSDFVSLNSYIVVQDTIICHSRLDDGPGGAVKEFLKTNKDFVIDYDIGKKDFIPPYSFLKRIK